MPTGVEFYVMIIVILTLTHKEIGKVTHIYHSVGYKVYPRSCKVVSPDGKENIVRAKTFQVLQMLLDGKGHIQSKENILKTIWNDVVVDEQVIFQSIKELRKVFGDCDVIKTYPRKGYAWIPNIELVTDIPLESNAGSQPSDTKGLISYLKRAALVVFVVLIGYVTLQQFVNTAPIISGSIVVLPVKTDITDSDHKWVRYGAMDQLVQRLSSSDHHGVLQTGYVLEVLARVQNLHETINQQDIRQIFQVSGATLIIELKLTGNVQDYQLIYSLHEKNGLERGAVLDNTIGGAVDQVAVIVAARLGQNSLVDQGEYYSAFSNEMLANALEFIQDGNTERAITLLEAAISTEPDNIAAKRILIRLMLETFEHDKAHVLLVDAMQQAKATNNTKEMVRLLFWQAGILAQQGKMEQALASFQEAELAANKIKDWLFLAYIAEMRGRIHQSQQAFSAANIYYEEAMKYHQVLQCPFGQSNVLLALSSLSFAQGDVKAALLYANQSLTLIDQRQLLKLKPKAQQWLQTLIGKKDYKR
jgi:DNA-binding winged helix-turn-helix (wHTH) protein/tetratricopeptide (TPR) repeat protein